MWQRWTRACLYSLLAPIAVHAGPSDATVTAELVEALAARIAQLERKVVELETQLRRSAPPGNASSAAAAAEANSKLEPAPAHSHVQVAQELANPPMDTQSPPSVPKLQISGFSDVNFVSSDQRGSRSGFTEGQFALHTTTALSPRVNVFGELTLTARSDVGTGVPPAPGFNAEVERILIRFDQSDYFKVSFGRFHTPINWWNTSFHHGQWLQTTASRPEMVQFGGRFIPVHFVGGLVEGALPAGGLRLNYTAGVGNGRGSVISRGGDAGDENNNRAWLVNVFIKPDRPFGLLAGASVYRDKITQGARSFQEWIHSAHLVWQKENPEFIAEVANVRHTETGRPGGFNSQAFYMQLGYRLRRQQQWKPYYRFEYIHIPASDPVFRGVPSLAGSVAGIRYDLTHFAAFKVEYRNLRRPGLPRINLGFAQTSFTF